MRIESNINRIVDIIKAGKIVCTPTDTLFALVCDATNPIAIDKLYKLKKRNKEKKLPIFFSDLEHVKKHCILPEIAMHLANEFWPGKLTMILKLRGSSDIAMNAFDIENSLAAVRVPGNESILSIIRLLGKPIIGTSANVSGESNINSYTGIEEQFRSCNIVVFKTTTFQFSTQSTIISFDGNKAIILRDGAISEQEIVSLISSFEVNLTKQL